MTLRKAEPRADLMIRKREQVVAECYCLALVGLHHLSHTVIVNASKRLSHDVN
jgi:hypothetical protein